MTKLQLVLVFALIVTIATSIIYNKLDDVTNTPIIFKTYGENAGPFEWECGTVTSFQMGSDTGGSIMWLNPTKACVARQK